jgi:NADPH2:quinone reductase
VGRFPVEVYGPHVLAIEVTAFGGPELLRLAEHEAPTAGRGQVLVRVEALGLNWSDVLQRRGTYPGGPTPPFISGQEAAGIVVARGQGVTAPPIGARVSIVAPRLGAGFVAVPAEACITWPTELPPEQRAALPIALLTAYHGLVNCGRARAGEICVVHAAAGGLGHVAVQVARALGMTTIGTASAAKRSHVTADVVCGYSELRDAAKDGVDLVLDGVGGEAFPTSVAALRPGGRIVIVGASSGEPQRIDATKLVMRSQSMIGVHLRHLFADRELLRETIEACTQLDVKATVSAMPAQQIAAAHSRLESRDVIGKLVVTF